MWVPIERRMVFCSAPHVWNLQLDSFFGLDLEASQKVSIGQFEVQGMPPGLEGFIAHPQSPACWEELTVE